MQHCIYKINYNMMVMMMMKIYSFLLL